MKERAMRMTRAWLAAVGGVVATSLFLSVRADEEKVPLDRLPRAVAAAVKKRFAGAEMVAASKEVEDGKTLYEVGLKDKGRKTDVTVSADGQIQEIEAEMAAKDLPKEVADALDSKYPKATLKKAESITKVKDGREKLESYEVVLVTAAGKTFEVVLSPDGKITKEESKGKEKAKEKAKANKE
jgi:hypothetical protein